MKKLYQFFFVIIILNSCTSGNIKSYIQQNTHSLKTIEPDSTDFSDLEVIGNAIGDSRIVMLGEQDHGDAPTFLAKTRLIKYLQEKKGFDVLAFESDFFALNEGWDNLEKEKTKIDTFLRNNIFSIWTNCRQNQKLFYNHISNGFNSKNPIDISGFDSQTHGKYSNILKLYIGNLIKAKNISSIKNEGDHSFFLNFIDSVRTSKDQIKFKLFINQISAIINEIPKDSNNFDLMLLKSIRSNFESELDLLKKGKKYLDIRDKQMSENLEWLVKYKYPNRKIIVWAHNVHILKNKEFIRPTKEERPFENFTNMGHIFTKDSLLNNQTYIIGFNSKDGTAGRITDSTRFTVGTPSKESFENWMPTQLVYGFVDFKKYRLTNPDMKPYFNMKGKYHVNNFGAWTQVYDGVFYIRDMYPCDKIN